MANETDRKRDRDSLEPASDLDDANPDIPFSEAEEDDQPERERIENDFLDESEDEEGEDLFAENIIKYLELISDYKPKPEYDNYDNESADGEQFEPLTRQDRQIAEERMRRRDREEGRMPAAFMDDEDSMDEAMPVRRRRKDPFGMDDMDMDENEVAPLDHEELGDVKGQLSDYVTMEAPRQTIRNEFHRFLTSFVNEHGVSVYGERIKGMCEAESQSLEVDYAHLCATNATIAFFLTNAPAQILPIFNEVAMDVVLSGFENYENIFNEIYVRITNLPAVETLRDLRQIHLNTLIRVAGVVTKRTAVYPQLNLVKYLCLKCGGSIGPFVQDLEREINVNKCANCQSKGPFKLDTEQVSFFDLRVCIEIIKD